MAWPFIKLLPQKTNFHYVKWAPIIGGISALLCAVSLFLVVYPFTPPCGGLNCGVDFTGGNVMEVTADPRPVDLEQIRGTLNNLGLGDVQVQTFGGVNDALVKFETPEGGNAAETVRQASAALTQAMPDLRVGRTEAVGAKVSGELLVNGVLALVAAIGLMLAYIWFRFGLTFGLGAVAALTHDVILTFGLFALFDMEFTLTSIAAVLTIIGYSINDKVVSLDRVRENMRKYKTMPMGDLIDLSVNETLSRTLITGVTGIMALGILAAFGGEALFGFSISMIFGILVGTYSSIYISAPLLMVLGVRRGSSDDEKPVKLGMASRP
jgi:preprotein translocase SecF subunit